MHAPIERPPFTLGHETSGYVESVGTDVDGFAEGDPVLVYLVWACGECRACLEGRDNACERAGGRLGMPPAPGLGPDGGMAEYIVSKARYLEPLGTLDPVTAGPLADAALTSQHAIEGARYRIGAGTTSVVIGLGGLGHVGLQILKATSQTRVIAVDVQQSKLDLAASHGADHTLLADDSTAAAILELTDGYGADAVFDFVGVQSSVDLGLDVHRPRRGDALRRARRRVVHVRRAAVVGPADPVGCRLPQVLRRQPRRPAGGARARPPPASSPSRPSSTTSRTGHRPSTTSSTAGCSAAPCSCPTSDPIDLEASALGRGGGQPQIFLAMWIQKSVERPSDSMSMRSSLPWKRVPNVSSVTSGENSPVP